MTDLLESYAAGRWFRATDEGTPLLDAATGEEVARISSTGLDLGAMVEHARRVGGPALRALTFHERATQLKALATHLSGLKDEMYALSTRTGATRRDSLVDIDGGIGTVFSFASKGKRELPNDTVVLDGPLEQLGRGGTFVGQHVYTSRPGVAVQINAFNFPVWGMLEKLAPAFLAGLPTIVKPAGQTAYLTELVVRRIIESGLLPEGSLQLLCGSPRGLLDELTVQDSVAFTGSAHTAGLLRNHTNVLHGGVSLGVEADSLNCSVLGPDVTTDDPEFELYVKGVVAEMTVKAGQKCTAIRRAIVPDRDGRAGGRGGLGAAGEGHRRQPRPRRRPDGRAGEPRAARGGPQGGPGAARLLPTWSSATPTGSTWSTPTPSAARSCRPLLLRATRGAIEPHESSRSARSRPCSATTRSTRPSSWRPAARASLVGSLVTHDPDVARAVTLGVAPWHGRILVLDRDDAKESTGHGSPLPMLVHGGPGRAGGGEELGGVRAVLHHMQRTAVQASPDMMTAITGRWTTGSQRRVDRTHPFRKSLAELAIGDTVETATRTVSLEDVEHFAEFTGDTFYAHTDPEAAARNPLFGGIVAHGYLVVSLAAGLFVDPDPGPVLANFGVDQLRFLTPVKAGDTIRVLLTVKQITPRSSADYGEVRWDAVVVNQDDDPVATYDVLTLVAKTWDDGQG